jgi:hypothetical protein
MLLTRDRTVSVEIGSFYRHVELTLYGNPLSHLPNMGLEYSLDLFVCQ